MKTRRNAKNKNSFSGKSNRLRNTSTNREISDWTAIEEFDESKSESESEDGVKNFSHKKKIIKWRHKKKK